MERQRSILSFFQKPQPPPPPPSASSDPITGTDTPPEKLPRPPLLSRFHAPDRPTLPISSIMRKLDRGSESKGCVNGNLEICKGPVENPEGGMLGSDPLGSILPNSQSNDGLKKRTFPSTEPCLDELGPETPLMQPFVPRLKRIKGDENDVNQKLSILSMESTKRMKSLRESGFKEEVKSPALTPGVMGSKFEWLNPSSIRDANGRSPNDPSYDKTSLFIPAGALSKMSATQRQYWEVKRRYMDIVVFFKVGKFYELYELDAEIGQKELDWKMTHSGVGKCRQVGISESGIDDAVQKLVARGYKVGRMEQLETSDQAKSRGASSVIQRKLVQVSCPSTTTDSSMGADAVHLLALKEGGCGLMGNSIMYGFAFLDYAELKLCAGFIHDDSSFSALGALLVQISPKEIVYERQGLSKEALKVIKKYASTGCRSVQFTPTSGGHFLDSSEVGELISSRGYFKNSFKSWVSTIDCQVDLDLALCTLGGLIDHLSRLKLDDALCNGDVLPYHVYECGLKMDGQTLVNLEIFNNNVNGGSSGTLYKHLDHCSTSSGKRLLRRWICNPLKSVEQINKRLDTVEGLLNNPGMSSVISQYLRRLPDLERLLGRVKSSVGSSAVLLLPTIGEKLLKQQVKSFGSLVKGLRVGVELLKLLLREESISLPFSMVLNLPDLGELDDFLNHFEVAIDGAFPNYQDPDVTETDAQMLSQLIEPFTGKIAEWSQVIHSLNCVDVLLAFALTANSSRGSMSRPVLLPVDSHSTRTGQESRAQVLKMKGLWHPYAIAENGGPVVPNDICLGENSNGCYPRTLLLTGPNMGGKSTLLRATCLSVILAQLGCFVPCDSCVLSPVDIIFTRLGALDRIMSGESTFFVECAETASILQNATEDSLVVLDELGRGTSTFDGYAIAYAVFRHLLEKVHCRLLFATHYHPLPKEFASHPLVSLQHMACAFLPKTSCTEDGEQELFFLYRLTPGACPESYGLQVALMAGIPNCVVEAASRARETMKAMIGKAFRSSELRSEFSSYHEECLKALLAASQVGDRVDEDYFDTLLCLWHEVKSLCHGKLFRE